MSLTSTKWDVSVSFLCRHVAFVGSCNDPLCVFGASIHALLIFLLAHIPISNHLLSYDLFFTYLVNKVRKGRSQHIYIFLCVIVIMVYMILTYIHYVHMFFFNKKDRALFFSPEKDRRDDKE